MLLRSPILQEDILTLPAQPAGIAFMRGDYGSEIIFYTVDVLVDIDGVLDNDSYNLKAEVFRKKPEPPPVKSRVRSARSFKRKTKRLEKKVRSVAKRRKEEVLARVSVDLTKFISNDLANVKSKNLTRQQMNSIASASSILKPLDPFTENSKASFVPSTPGVVKLKTVKKSSKSPTKRTKTLSTTVDQSVKTVKPKFSKFSKSALKSKIDPASVSAASVTSLTSILPKTTISMASSIVFTAPTSLELLPIVRATPRRKKVNVGFRLKRSDLVDASSFYLKLELENEKGVKIDEASCVVPHARILNNFVTPNIPPFLEAEYIKPGIISVRVKPPKDRMAKTMKVFRRLSAPTEGGTDNGSSWQIVFNSTIEDLSEITFRDNIATSRPVLYRAVSYGENSKPSERFESTVVLPLKQFKVEQTGSLTAVPSMTTAGSNTFVKVAVKDIPDDVVAVMLRRYDLTTASDAKRKASTGSGFTYVGQTAQRQVRAVENLGPDSTVAFTDTTTKTGRTYRFVPIGITRTGKEIVGSSALLEIPLSPSREKVRISVSAPKVTTAGPLLGELVFDLSATFTEFGFSEVQNTLESGGQKSLFDNDLIQDRDKFESLISFLVERRNSRTGEEESFGVVQAGQFFDNPESRREKNVKPPEPGTEYTYTFTALIASAETLFPTLTRPDVDIQSLKAFSRKVSKFQNPLSLNRATLQSTQRQRDKTKPSSLEPADPIVAGRTDVQVVHEIRFPIQSTAANKLRIEKYRGFNRLVWKVSEADKIDHFKIFVAASGGKVLIDTVHCDDSSSEFYYRHFNDGYSVNYKYIVQPVDLAYEEMDPIYGKSIRAINTLRAAGLSNLAKIKRL